MNTSVVEAVPLPGAPDLAGLEPVEKIKRRWPAFVGGALTLLMIVALGRELFGSGLAGLYRTLPTNPLFYIVFALYYVGPPTFDYIIFKRLWQIPLAGLAALHKKRISNEVLFGYSGEAYFYAWARARLQMVAAPFAAIKDVSILSAIVGNVVTLALLAFAAPFAISLIPAGYVGPVLGSIGAILALSLAALLFRGRIFSLSNRDLIWIFAVHLLRTILYTGLLALCWHLALPDVPLGIWALLVTGRQLVARLPLVPNKDIVFANLALLLVGNDAEVARLVALTVALTLLCHVVVLAASWLPFRKAAAA